MPLFSNGPTKGNATINATSGEWSYTPRTDEVGQDSFIVTITDDAGFKFAQKIELSVTTDNIKPVITSTSTVNPVNENNPIDLLVYTASATDDTTPSTAISYELGSNEFNNGNAIFSIDSKTGAVKLNSSLNYEDPLDSDKNNTYNFSIVAKDQAGNTSEAKSLSLPINNVSLAPTITSKNSVALDENSSGVNNIVYQATSDYSYQLTWGLKGVDASYFDIGASDGKITLAKDPSTGAIKAFPNYEEKSLYSVTLLANGIEGQ